MRALAAGAQGALEAAAPGEQLQVSLSTSTVTSSVEPCATAAFDSSAAIASHGCDDMRLHVDTTSSLLRGGGRGWRGGAGPRVSRGAGGGGGKQAVRQAKGAGRAGRAGQACTRACVAAAGAPEAAAAAALLVGEQAVGADDEPGVLGGEVGQRGEGLGDDACSKAGERGRWRRVVVGCGRGGQRGKQGSGGAGGVCRGKGRAPKPEA